MTLNLHRCVWAVLLVVTATWTGIPGSGPAAGATSVAAPCAAILPLVGGKRDAGPALQACLDSTPTDGTVALLPGRYRIATPIRVRHPVTLTTRGLAHTAARCASDERRCAVLHLAIAPGATVAAGIVMPFDVTSDRVWLDHLVFQGTRLSDPGLSARRCASGNERALAGGLRINGNSIAITRSVIRDIGCYTALEYGVGVGVVIADNEFTGNGTHTVQDRWADGLTIHDARDFRITGNRFRDNTDIQLILGSCVGCRISGNSFTHSRAETGGSFAELMLQAWPNATSGDFTGTQVSGNVIDCGAFRRCGFGIMIGSTPWYAAPAFGGAVVRNRVRGAMLALNVEDLTGPMVIEHNDLERASGTYPSMCGARRIVGVAANFSQKSRAFLPHAPTNASTTSERYCILNYALIPTPR